MKRKILSLILVFAMTVSLLTVGAGAAEPTYGDTAGHWAEDSIERWSSHGIVQGSNDLFDPNGQLTCAQLATILAKLLKLPVAKDAGFTDNKADTWYYDAINRCAAAGILNGNGDGTVSPNATISRERAIVMLGRALGIEPIENPDLTKYGDAAKVSAYAQGMVAAMIEAGIVGGVTADKLAPQDNINRASTVTILDRAIAVYADEDGETIDASKVNGLILIAAKNVTVKNAPKGTSVLVCKDASGATVNGKIVDAGTSAVAEEAQPAKPAAGGGSSGGSTPSHSNLTVAEAKTVSGGTYQNVTITDAVGNGEVTLTGLTIHGDLTVKGGGSNSIKLIDCIILGRIIMNKLISVDAEQPRLELTNTPARKIDVQSPAIIEATDENSKIDAMEVKDDLTIKGDKTAVDSITVPAGAEPKVDVKDGSKVDRIEAKGTTTVETTGGSVVGTIAAESNVNVSGNINAITVPETANDSVNIAIGSGTTVPEVTVNSDKGTTISGEGTVSNIAASSDAAKDSISGEKVDLSAIADHVHTWDVGTVTIEAKCSSTGIKTYICTVDGCSASKSETLPVLGHKWGSWEKVNETNHKRVCANDASHIETAEHSWDAGVITTAATCTEKGIKTYTCAICSAGKTEDVDALGHDYAADFTVDKAANCTEAGSKSKHCSRCDAKGDVTEIPATGHTFAAEWSKDADYHWHAATCGHTAEVKDKAEHSWNSGVVTTPATTTTTGVKTYTCTVCNATKTETIPATGESVVAPAKGISSIEQQGMYLAISMTAPESMEHIGYFTFSFYDSTCETESLMTGITCKKDELTFYVEASKFDPALNYDKAKITAIAEEGFADAVWTGDVRIDIAQVTLDYEVAESEDSWGLTFKQSAPGFFQTEYYKQNNAGTTPDDTSYSYTRANNLYQSIGASFGEVTPAGGGTVKLARGWKPVIEATDNGWKLDVTLYTPGTRTTHEHTYSTDWSKDADYHWHAATCGHTAKVKDKAEHSWDSGVVTAPATTTSTGVKTYTCLVCEATKTEDVPVVSASKLRWESAGVLTWDSEEGVTNYKVEIKNNAGSLVGESKYQTTRCSLRNDLCKADKWMASSGVFSVEVFAMNDEWQIIKSIGTIENAVNLTVDGSVDYTYEVTGEKTYTLTLKQGALTGTCFVRWTTNNGFSQHTSFAADGNTMTYEKTRERAFCDGDEIGLRIVTSNTLNGNTWTLTATPIVTKTYQSVQDTKAWINATESNLKLEWTRKDGYTGLYYVNGTNVGSGTTCSLINTVRNAAQSGTYPVTISTKEDASSSALTPYVTLENALTVSIDTAKTPAVTIKGLEDGNYKFVSNNGFAGMYDYDMCAPDDSVIREWWAKAGSTAALAPYEGCKFKVRELSWDKTGENLTAITVSASGEGTFGFTPFDFSTLSEIVTDESTFSAAVNKGGKVILENDITITNTQINRGGDVEIDLNGHTLDLGASNSLAISKAVKLTDSSVAKTGTIAGTSGIRCDAGSKLDLNGITVARITDAGKMRGITIENCKVTYLIQLTYANEMNVVNTDFSGDVQVKIYNSTASFDGCKFNGGSDQNIFQLNGDANVTLDNATFSGGKVSFVRSNNNLTLKRGTYCFDPTSYVPTEGYTVAYDQGTSIWTVSASASA